MASGYLCLFLFTGLLAAAVDGVGTAESSLVAHAHVAIDLKPMVGPLAQHLTGNVLTSGAASIPSGIESVNYSPSSTSDQTGTNQVVVWSSDPTSSWKFKEPSSWTPSKGTTVSPTEPAATGDHGTSSNPGTVTDLATTLSSGTGGGSGTTASAETTPSPVTGEVTTTVTAPATTAAAAAAETSLTTEPPTTGGTPAAQVDTTTTASPETTSSAATTAEQGTGTGTGTGTGAGTTQATQTTTPGFDRSEIPGTVEAQAKVRSYMLADGYNSSFIETVLQKWPLTTGKIYREAQAKVRAQIQARTQTQPSPQVETTAAPTTIAPTTSTPTPTTTRPPYQPPTNLYPGYNVNQYSFPGYNQPTVNKYQPPTNDWTKYNAPQIYSQTGYQQRGWPSSSGSRTQYPQSNTQVKYPQTQERQQPSWTQRYNPPAQTQTPQYRQGGQQQNTWKPNNQETYFQRRYPAYNTYTQQNSAQKTAYNPPTRGIMAPSSGTPPGVDPSKIRYFGQPGTQKPTVQPGPTYNKPPSNGYPNYPTYQNSQRYQPPSSGPGSTNTRRQQTQQPQQGETNEQVVMKVMTALQTGDLPPRMVAMMFIPEHLQNSPLAQTMKLRPDYVADLAESAMGYSALLGLLQ